jgi:ADP-heptose:LPS heptosyltransferase
MRVLALVPGGISDQLLFFPTLEDIRRAFPKAEIDVVVEPKAQAAYRVSKLINDVISFDYPASNSPADWANLLGIVRDREFEVAISTSGRWEEGILLWLSGIPTRLTYATTSVPWFYTNTLPYQDNQYQADRYHNLLQGLKIKSPCPPVTINVPESDINWANGQRDKLGLKQGYVIFYPSPSALGYRPGKLSKTPPEDYPLDSWLAIIADFQTKQPQLPLVLLSTPESRDTVTAITRSTGGLKAVATENIGQSAAMIAGADLVIAPDTYVAQIAVALSVFNISLFGATNPDQILPSQAGVKEPKFVALKSKTGQLEDLTPADVLKTVWGG